MAETESDVQHDMEFFALWVFADKVGAEEMAEQVLDTVFEVH